MKLNTFQPDDSILHQANYEFVDTYTKRLIVLKFMNQADLNFLQ